MPIVHKPNKNTTANRKAVKETKSNVISDEAMERLAQIMNNSPTIVKLNNTEWKITALKPGTQWLIAEEACKIIKGEKLSMGDVIKEFSKNLPSVARVITLALLNDKDRIYSDEYQKLYDLLLWGDYGLKDWITLLVEILNLLNLDFFFASTNVIATVRNQALGMKIQATELSRQEQNMVK